MKIGIITYYRVPNFGANIQAFSTYNYLKSRGFEPIMIHFMSPSLYKFSNTFGNPNDQKKAHIEFVDKHFTSQTEVCYTSGEVQSVISKYGIQAVIIGSDAVVQHHPLFERMHYDGDCHRHFRIDYIPPEQMYPSVFWGAGLPVGLIKVMMSVSSQNSKYKYFLPSLKKRMRASLSDFAYISARDEWTNKMFCSILGHTVPVTPDPVFAFNQNCKDFVPTEKEIRKEFGLNRDYLLVCLRSQSLSLEVLKEIKTKFSKQDVDCVALPMPTGVMFKHPFEYEIPCPLPSDKWYGLIKYAYGYVGSNMHPIIVSLHNAVPCFSLDDWINYNFWNKPQNDGSSKVEHIMSVFGVQNNRRVISDGVCSVTSNEIVNGIINYPRDRVKQTAAQMYDAYCEMMNNIISKFK